MRIPAKDLRSLTVAELGIESDVQAAFAQVLNGEVPTVMPPFDALTTTVAQENLSTKLEKVIGKWTSVYRPNDAASSDAMRSVVGTWSGHSLSPKAVRLVTNLLQADTHLAKDIAGAAHRLLLYGYYGDGAHIDALAQTLDSKMLTVEHAIATIQALTLLALRDIEPERVVQHLDAVARAGVPLPNASRFEVKVLAADLVAASVREGLVAIQARHRERRLGAQLCEIDRSLPECQRAELVAARCGASLAAVSGSTRGPKDATACQRAWNALSPWQRAFAAVHAAPAVAPSLAARVWVEAAADPEAFGAVPETLRSALYWLNLEGVLGPAGATALRQAPARFAAAVHDLEEWAMLVSADLATTLDELGMWAQGRILPVPVSIAEPTPTLEELNEHFSILARLGTVSQGHHMYPSVGYLAEAQYLAQLGTLRRPVWCEGFVRDLADAMQPLDPQRPHEICLVVQRHEETDASVHAIRESPFPLLSALKAHPSKTNLRLVTYTRHGRRIEWPWAPGFIGAALQPWLAQWPQHPDFDVEADLLAVIDRLWHSPPAPEAPFWNFTPKVPTPNRDYLPEAIHEAAQILSRGDPKAQRTIVVVAALESYSGMSRAHWDDINFAKVSAFTAGARVKIILPEDCESGRGGGGCFTGSQRLQRKDGGTISFAELAALQEANDGRPVTTQVPLPELASFDESTRQVIYQRPRRVLVHPQLESALMYLRATARDGRTMDLEVTTNHHLLVARDGKSQWLAAGDLRAGDALVGPNGAQFAYEPNATRIESGARTVYDVSFGPKGATPYPNYLVSSDGQRWIVAHNKQF